MYVFESLNMHVYVPKFNLRHLIVASSLHVYPLLALLVACPCVWIC